LFSSVGPVVSDPQIRESNGIAGSCRPSSLFAFSAVLLVATTSPLRAGPSPNAHALFDAPVDAVWDATLESLRGAGYKVREEHRTSGTISARRTRVVGRMNEEEATNELKQIYRPEPRVGINVRGMSEYYVALTARIGPSDGKTGLDVVAKITAVFRRRGGTGAPLPVALTSNGFLEQELVQRVQDRLAHGAPQEIPAPP
jgi:hypothetical protein